MMAKKVKTVKKTNETSVDTIPIKQNWNGIHRSILPDRPNFRPLGENIYALKLGKSCAMMKKERKRIPFSRSEAQDDNSLWFCHMGAPRHAVGTLGCRLDGGFCGDVSHQRGDIYAAVHKFLVAAEHIALLWHIDGAMRDGSWDRWPGRDNPKA